ncbi:hypothetical protein [Flyfo myovirus Tbat2_7]|nr:hypothetical protein [Flyfo myovirus Tbat2_7]
MNVKTFNNSVRAELEKKGFVPEFNQNDIGVNGVWANFSRNTITIYRIGKQLKVIHLDGGGFGNEGSKISSLLIEYSQKFKNVQITAGIRMYPDDFEKLKSQKEETGLPWASFIKVLIKEHEQLNSGEKNE